MTSAVQNAVVLVTGGAGFIGSALVRELLSSGAKVISYDNYLHGTPKSFEDLSEYKETEQLVAIDGSVFDQRFLKKQINDHNVNYVINCIGDPFIPAAYIYPERCYKTNAEGTSKVLEVVKDCKIERMIHISSCEVHGKNEVAALAENDRINPCSTYARSKYRAERYCHEFVSQFRYHDNSRPLLMARLFNCYGPRATHPYIIPEIIEQLSNGNTLYLGNLTERDFTYVHDTARAVIALLVENFPSPRKDDSEQLEVINVGSGISYDIARLAHLIAEIMEVSDLKIVTSPDHQRQNDIPRFVCDNTKLRQCIAWMPEIDIEEGLRETIAWFKAHNCRWNFSPNDQ